MWLDNLPVAQFQDSYDAQGVYIGTELTYLHADHLGTPRIGTSQGRQITWRYQSDGFGVPAVSGTAVVQLRFPGQLALGIGGLHYNYFRDYEPQVGRYLESDPIGLGGGPNTFGYARQNPLLWLDPFGLDVQLCRAPAQIAAGLVDHVWLKTSTKEAGMMGAVENAGNEYESLYVTKVVIGDHRGQSDNRPGASCEVVEADESKVNEILQIGKPLGRFSPFNNCQTFADEVLYMARTPEQRARETEKQETQVPRISVPIF